VRHRPRKSTSRIEDRVSIQCLRFVNQIFGRIYHRLEIHSPCRLPRDGGGILVCNHISSLDPMLLQSVAPRLITWMMAKEYLELPMMGWFFRTIGIIPVERSGRDLSSTRAAMRALHNGQILGVFPEGRISTTGDFLKFQTGVALLAMKTGVPIYPAYLEGSQRNKEMLQACLLPNTAHVAFGEPFTLHKNEATREALEAATDDIQQSLDGLRERFGLYPAIPHMERRVQKTG
jgi:1-acyl-sn-glycerol-3-phosphate acyltransferase